MFHVFHKHLIDIARKAVNAVKKRDYAQAMTLSEELSESLINLKIGSEHENFKKEMSAYH